MTTKEVAKLFCVMTVANDLVQYGEMRRSLAKSGFTEDCCRFVLFDNHSGNAHEPYSAINRTLDEVAEPYVIACHQDILLDQGPGIDQLVAQIARLNAKHSNGAVAENCGGKSNLSEIYHLHDPNGFHHAAPLPQQVRTLDENFLVIRREAGVRCSKELSGFHLYAADLCLHAAERGKQSFVIDFYFTHLSGGNIDSNHFKAGLREFQQHWNPKFAVPLVRTPCISFYLSRSAALRGLLARKPLMKMVRAGFKVLRVIQEFRDKKQSVCA